MESWIIARYKLKRIFTMKQFIVFFYFPLILFVLIGFIFSANITSQIPIAIVDEDQSQYSAILLNLMKDNGALDVHIGTSEDVKELTRRNKVEGAYIIKEGFEEQIKKDNYPTIYVLKSSAALGADAISEIVASGVVRILSNTRAANIITQEYDRLALANYYNREQLWQEVYNTSESYWYPDQLMELKHIQFNLEGEQDDVKSSYSSFVILGIIVLFLPLALGPLFTMIMKERINETLRRVYLICSKTKILLGYLITMTIIQAIQIILYIIVSRLYLGIKFGLSNITLFIILLMYSFLTSSIVLTLSIKAKNYVLLSTYYTLIVVITSVIGGVFWPIEMLADPFQKIALLTPQGLVMRMIKLTQLNEYNYTALYGLVILTLSILLIEYSGRQLSKNI
ncbi:ABC transporter permease [Serpentinicella sp. ANB-PHB4]|uniref:ABC transporter permease n=1 Tax=Serpentinicella sp. ANB-PHB4 TaxID=3074076 RepID=UPI002854CFB3|nr:ABC transporter permease [Serpentinicella sp. ANB-PHB4]MDR5658359.1 ABC transporter permease [Serpentinicella sp. ANB-PHB4]